MASGERAVRRLNPGSSAPVRASNAGRAALFLAGLIAVCQPPLAARANDSAATLSAGGLVLEKTADIAIVSEDLRVSVERIEVDYVFENLTDRDIGLTIAFPFPETFVDDFDGLLSESRSGQLVDFTTRFEDRPIEAREVIEIIGLDGRSLTGLFQREGFPLSPTDEAYGYEAFSGDDPKITAMKARMRHLGLLGAADSRKWKVRVSYVWPATFPAGAKVAVRHSYRPLAGAFPFSVRPPGAPTDIEDFESWFKARFCPSAEQWGRLLSLAGEVGTPPGREVGYVLRTGGNWARPIGSFRLTLDKGREDNILLSCWKRSLTPASPTTLVFEARDYVPDQDLAFAVVEGARD